MRYQYDLSFDFIGFDTGITGVLNIGSDALWIGVIWIISIVLYSVLGRRIGFYHPSFVGFMLLPFWPVSLLIRGWAYINAWYDSVFTMGKRSTGGWASTLYIMAHWYRAGWLHLGRVWCLGFELAIPIGIKLQRCLVLFGAPGSSKTVILQTMAGLWPGGVVSIDPDGQIARTIGGKQRSFRINPDNPNQSHKFNPFWQMAVDIERNGQMTAAREFERFGYSTVETPANTKEPIFPNMARLLICMATSWMMAYLPKDQWTFKTLRRLITKGLSPEKFNNDFEAAIIFFISECSQCDAWGGYTSECAAAIQSAGGNFYGSILSEARQQTTWMGWPSIQKISEISEFEWIEDIKGKGCSVYFNAQISDLKGPLKGWVSLCVNSMLSSFESNKTRPKHRTLLIVDEAQNQNPTELLKSAPAWVRKHHVSVIYSFQDMQGAINVFGQEAEGTIGGADAVMWLASPHTRNLDYLKRTLGKATRTEKVSGGWFRRKRTHYTQVERDLSTEEQLKRYLSLGNNAIITRSKGRAFRVKTAPFFKELPVWKYTADTLHSESLFRRIFRSFLSLFTVSHSESNSAAQPKNNSSAQVNK